MSAISWSETTPLASSNASSGDDELRSFMTNVARGLQPAFYWPGSGGGSAASAGQSQPGNMRMVRVATSVATRADNGFLQLNSTRVAIEHIGTWIGPLGHSNMLHVSSSTTAGGGLSWPQASRWLMQTGSFTVTSSGSSFTQAVSFASAFIGTPTFVSALQTDDGVGGLVQGARYICAVQAGSLTSTGFIATVSSITSGSATGTVGWFSLGTAAF